MTKQFIMDTLGIQENDPRVPLLDVLNHGEIPFDESQLLKIIDHSSVNSEFLQPLVDHLSAHPSDKRNESIVTFLYFTILLQRNAAGTMSPDVLMANPRNKLGSIEQQLFDFLTIQLNNQDLDMVQKCSQVVNGLVNCIGIDVPHALFVQLMKNTVSHSTNSADERASDLASSELFIIATLLYKELALTANSKISYNADVGNFHQSLKSLDADELYKPQVLNFLEALKERGSAHTQRMRTEVSTNKAEQGEESLSHNRRLP